MTNPIRPAAMLLAALLVPVASIELSAQSGASPASSSVVQTAGTLQAYDSAMFAALRWREIGPFRGGRSVAAAGSAARPMEYYFGTTGGGVFKTTDGGMTRARVFAGDQRGAKGRRPQGDCPLH